MMVHFPIVLLVLWLLVEWLVVDWPHMWLLAAATMVSLLVAAMAGLWAQSQVQPSGQALSMLLAHRDLAFRTMVLMSIDLLMLLFSPYSRWQRYLYRFTLVATFLFMVLTAYDGGELVYRFGVGVSTKG